MAQRLLSLPFDFDMWSSHSDFVVRRDFFAVAWLVAWQKTCRSDRASEEFLSMAYRLPPCLHASRRNQRCSAEFRDTRGIMRRIFRVSISHEWILLRKEEKGKELEHT